MTDKRPGFWIIGLFFIALVPQLSGSTRFLTVATTFAIFAAVNLMWSLVIDTAGLLSLATLAVVGAGAYIASWLSIDYGLPWWLFMPVGGLTGLLLGFILALPARRMDGMYFALLTMGVAELCRVYVQQSETFGRKAGRALFGAASFIPERWAGRLSGARLSAIAAVVVLLGALPVYRAVGGERLGLLLATAQDDEAFAEAIGIDYFRARLEVFLISSAALGVIGGFYAAVNRGVGPSLSSLRSDVAAAGDDCHRRRWPGRGCGGRRLDRHLPRRLVHRLGSKAHRLDRRGDAGLGAVQPTVASLVSSHSSTTSRADSKRTARSALREEGSCSRRSHRHS